MLPVEAMWLARLRFFHAVPLTSYAARSCTVRRSRSPMPRLCPLVRKGCRSRAGRLDGALDSACISPTLCACCYSFLIATAFHLSFISSLRSRLFCCHGAEPSQEPHTEMWGKTCYSVTAWTAPLTLLHSFCAPGFGLTLCIRRPLRAKMAELARGLPRRSKFSSGCIQALGTSVPTGCVTDSQTQDQKHLFVPTRMVSQGI